MTAESDDDGGNYLKELTAEKEGLSPSYGHALRLLQQGEQWRHEKRRWEADVLGEASSFWVVSVSKLQALAWSR